MKKRNRFYCSYCKQKRKLVPSHISQYIHVCKSCGRVPGSIPFTYKLRWRPPLPPEQ